MPTPQITIRDIARELGVSVSTVSRALRDSPDISAERRRVVQEYAREHNYTPNLIASSLRASRTSTSKIIGVVVPKILHYFFSNVLMGIEEEAMSEGYRVMVAQSSESNEKERTILDAFEESRVCGLIISQAEDTKDYSHYRKFIDKDIPVIFYDRICTGLQTPRVVVDDYMGAYSAVEHLINTGCKRICFMGSAMNLEISKNRLNGYKDALLKHGLKPEKHMIISFDDAPDEDGEAAIMREILTRRELPDGFLANNDAIGVKVLNSCKRAGLRIPDEVSICCFTNSERTRSSDPQLTCVDQRGYDVGKTAARLLIDKLNHQLDEHKQQNRIVKTKLILRGSTR